MATPNKPYVVYWNNMPAPYMVERFNALVRRGNLRFEAWFNTRVGQGRSWEVTESEWQFQYRYVPGINVAGNRFCFPLPLLGRQRPDLLVSLYAEPVFLIGWLIARLRGIGTMFRTLMTFDSWVTRRWWKEQLKHYIFSRVDGVETPGDDGRDFAMRYGTPPEKIYYATHAIDVDHYMKGRAAALPERESLRAHLGLRGVAFLYVGRLWKGKGLDVLMEAFGNLQKRSELEVSMLLIGDGPEEMDLRDYCRREHLRNVVFAGFHQKSELPRFYAVSDVFIFLTLGDPYGLVVNEAMACSLPVISTSAAGEIRDRIKEDVNGYIVPPQDSAALCERMYELTGNAELRSRMGAQSAKKMAGQTPDKWAADFEHAVHRILGST